jgi:hypothetical protein
MNDKINETRRKGYETGKAITSEEPAASQSHPDTMNTLHY